jgi:chemotaxis protein CheX
MNSHPGPTDNDLRVITEEVWASYLDPEGASPLMPVLSQDPQHDICAAVSITGAWSGHVVVACSGPASRHAAAALLGIAAEDVTLEDIADAMGEVANVIGGNVTQKSVASRRPGWTSP